LIASCYEIVDKTLPEKLLIKNHKTKLLIKNHKTLPKIFDNLFEYLKTSHSYNTRIRSNQNFFKPSVNTNIGKKSIQYREEVWQSLKLNIKLLGSTRFRTQIKYLLDSD